MTTLLCEGCGCGLSSMRESDLRAPRRSDVEEIERIVPRVPGDVMHALRLAFVVLLTAAAARWGLGQGGPAIAIVAFGVAGLFAVPIAVPGRYGLGRVDPAPDYAEPAPAGLPPRHG